MDEPMAHDGEAMSARAMALSGNVAGLRAALAAGASALGRGRMGETALHAVLELGVPGWLEVAKALAPASDLSARDERGRSLLAIAAERGLAEAVELLLSLPGSNPMTRDEMGWSALMAAAAKGHASCVDLLLPRMGGGEAMEVDLPQARILAAKSGAPALAGRIGAWMLAVEESRALSESSTAPEPTIKAAKPRI